MKCVLRFSILLAGLLFGLHSVTLWAQSDEPRDDDAFGTDVADYYMPFALPDLNANTLLGVTGNNVAQINSPKALQSTLQDLATSLLGGAEVPALGVEVAPGQFFMANTSASRYTKNAALRLAYNTSVSAAWKRDSTGNNRLALGLRMVLVDKSNILANYDYLKEVRNNYSTFFEQNTEAILEAHQLEGQIIQAAYDAVNKALKDAGSNAGVSHAEVDDALSEALFYNYSDTGFAKLLVCYTSENCTTVHSDGNGGLNKSEIKDLDSLFSLGFVDAMKDALSKGEGQSSPLTEQQLKNIYTKSVAGWLGQYLAAHLKESQTLQQARSQSREQFLALRRDYLYKHWNATKWEVRTGLIYHAPAGADATEAQVERFSIATGFSSRYGKNDRVTNFIWQLGFNHYLDSFSEVDSAAAWDISLGWRHLFFLGSKADANSMKRLSVEVGGFYTTYQNEAYDPSLDFQGAIGFELRLPWKPEVWTEVVIGANTRRDLVNTADVGLFGNLGLKYAFSPQPRFKPTYHTD